MKSLPLDMMTGQIKYLRLSIWSSSGYRVFFYYWKKKHWSSKVDSRNFSSYYCARYVHVLCDKGWLVGWLCVLVWRRWSLKESKSCEGHCARWLKGWFFSSATMGMVTTKIFSHIPLTQQLLRVLLDLLFVRTLDLNPELQIQTQLHHSWPEEDKGVN